MRTAEESGRCWQAQRDRDQTRMRARSVSARRRQKRPGSFAPLCDDEREREGGSLSPTIHVIRVYMSFGLWAKSFSRRS